jgi:glutamate/tyrosine decarboxylase-like PLP-dependent enzyme
MDVMEFITKKLTWLPPKFLSVLERRIKKIPILRQRIEEEQTLLTSEFEEAIKPYRDDFPSYAQIPKEGHDKEDILRELEALKSKEEARWRDGYASGAVYHGNNEHINFLNQVYAIHSQSNPLHADLWPSTMKFEAEIVAMTANMLGANLVDREIVGTVTSGGTESILLAMKAYRDWARKSKGITKPEMIAPVTAHAAFRKAAEYLNIKINLIPVDSGYRADVDAARKAITRNTAVMIGSAPSFPHGIIDPIEELAAFAEERNIGFHTDACLGGFLLPWAEKLGFEFPRFDFRVPGVTSISADTHKYGYAAKGTSVVLYRNPELRRYQYYTTTEWPGGLYYSPTFAGSRPGALSAVCWAAMLSVGEHGYMQSTSKILEAAARIKEGINSIPDLYILGDPLWVIAIASDTLNIYKIMDQMAQRNWSLNGLHNPPCVHICVTLPHTQPGVIERFLNDLSASIAFIQENPEAEPGIAPLYGMAATIPMRGLVDDFLKNYIDLLYKV